jgi:hypothetical protein
MSGYIKGFKEDNLKKEFRQSNRKKIIQEKGIVSGTMVVVSGRDMVREVENISADFFVKLKGAITRIDPRECNVFKG